MDRMNVSYAGIPMEYTLVGPGGKEYRLGQLVMTRGAARLIKQTRGGAKKVDQYLRLHARGECPDLPEEDQEANRLGVEQDGYLHTVWHLLKRDRTIWIITESDRSVTTILTPDEY